MKASTSAGEVAARDKYLTWADMIVLSVTALGESRRGSSVIAIKKYMVENYHIDPATAKPYMKRGLKSALDNERLIQVTGKGASGSFKLPPIKKSSKNNPAPVVEKKVKNDGKKPATSAEKKKTAPPKVMKVPAMNARAKSSVSPMAKAPKKPKNAKK